MSFKPVSEYEVLRCEPFTVNTVVDAEQFNTYSQPSSVQWPCGYEPGDRGHRLTIRIGDRCRPGLVGTFNQEKALIGVFSVIVKLQTSRRFVSSSNIYWAELPPAHTQSPVTLITPGCVILSFTAHNFAEERGGRDGDLLMHTISTTTTLMFRSWTVQITKSKRNLSQLWCQLKWEQS